MAEQRWHTFRAVGPEFADSAPVRHVITADIAQPRQAVFDAFADSASWPHWFPMVERACYDGPPPHGLGSIRRSWVNGVEHEERMVIWDAPKRWGYIILRATEPLSRAQIEVTEFEEIPGGTRIVWIIGTEPLPGFTFFAGDQDLQSFLADLLRRALDNLDRYLRSGAAPS